MLMKKIKIGIYITRNAIKLLNDIMSEKGGGGSHIMAGRTQEGGGGHSDAYCVQQGGWGGVSKSQEKMRMLLMEGP